MTKQNINNIFTNLTKWPGLLSILVLVGFANYILAFQFGDKSGSIDTWWINAAFDTAYILLSTALISILINKYLQRTKFDLCENLTGNEGYKPAIDGLRAIAVLVVVFYHAGFKGFSGGFIGVDVFFVISGYLITGHILNQLQKGKFTFSGFYEKRIRRILPALSVTLLITIGIGSWMFSPEMMQEMAWSGVAAITSWANLLFLSQSGYFNADSHTKLLLHTWSLSVEEQFYFLLPLFLFGLNKFFADRNKRASSILSITIASFLFSAIATFTQPDSAFYSIQFRAWELLFGSVINYLPKSQISAKKFLRLSIGAFGLILLPVFLYTANTPFPGLASLPPVLGTTFLIYTIGSAETIVQRTLKLPFFTFVGKISYSLYLWHWPLLLLFQYYLYRFGWQEYILWLIVTLLISTLSWRFVETPFRSRTFISKPFVFRLGLSTIILLATGFYFVNQNTEQIQKAYHPNVTYPDKKVWDSGFVKWEKCILPLGEFNIDEIDLCIIGNENIEPTFLLIGDSHAQVVTQGLDKVATQFGRSGLLLVTTGHPPIFDVAKASDRRAVITKEHITNLLRSYPIDSVLISSFWITYWNECDLKPVVNNFLDEILVFDKCERTRGLIQTGMVDIVNFFVENQIKPIIITQIPTYPFEVPNCVSSAIYQGFDAQVTCNLSFKSFVSATAPLNKIFESLVESYPTLYLIHPEDKLCDGVSCFSVVSNLPLYRDKSHLSTYGSLYLSDLFVPIFQK